MGQALEAMLGGPSLLSLFRRRVEKRVVVLGLDNAGKTTCVYRLLLGRKVDTVPTIGFNSEEVRHGRCSFIMWDIGGQGKIRKLWRHYVESADALVFVVDAKDRARLREARAAFKRMLRHKTLKNTVLLILANKTDYAGCMSLPEIVEGLDVRSVVGDRPWFVQRTCAISGQGLREGLDWLAQALEVQVAMERGMRRGGLALFSSQRAAAGQGGVAAAAAVAAAAGAGGNGRFGLRRGVNGSTNSSLSSMGEGSEGEGGGEKAEREEAGEEDARFGRRRRSSGQRRRRLSGSGGSTAAAAGGEGEAEEGRRSSRSGSWWQRLVGRDEEAEAARISAAQAAVAAFRSDHGDIGDVDHPVDVSLHVPGGGAMGAAEGGSRGLSNGSAHAVAAGTSGRLLQEPSSRGQGAGRPLPPLESEQEWEGGGRP